MSNPQPAHTFHLDLECNAGVPRSTANMTRPLPLMSAFKPNMALRALTSAFNPRTVMTTIQQTRRNMSNLPTNPKFLTPDIHLLWDPWQPSDLKPIERAAYEEHGPGFAVHMSNTRARKALTRALQRRDDERAYAARLGADWYALLKEAKRRLHHKTVAGRGIMAEVQRRKEAAKREGRPWSFDEEVRRMKKSQAPVMEAIVEELVRERDERVAALAAADAEPPAEAPYSTVTSWIRRFV